MSKRILAIIITWTVALWSIGTAIYAVKWIAEEMAKAEFFAILTIYHFVVGILPLFIIGLILIIVVELTIWGFLPNKG
jgi:hypothetical protein